MSHEMSDEEIQQNLAQAREELDSYIKGCMKFYDLDVHVETVYPNLKCLKVRSPSEFHVGDASRFALMDMDDVQEELKGPYYELYFLNATESFWSLFAKQIGIPMKLRVFVYPAPKKKHWYDRQEPNPVRYVLLDFTGDFPFFPDRVTKFA